MFRLAHLSDPHIPPDRRPRRREFLSQRIVGWTNWRRGRRDIHRREVLDVLTEDLENEAPDHIAVTGDLTIVSSRAEWAACRTWLAELGHGDHVSLVPGNHDAYTRGAVPATRKAWREYMTGDDDAAPHDPMARFPYLRRRGPIALVGVSSAIATAPFMATGRVGRSQIERLDAMLAEIASEGLFRVVLIHHPPLPSHGDRYRRLLDSKSFMKVVARHGAELVIHGHDHVSSVGHIEGQHTVPVIGVPSASALASGAKPAAAYNIYEIRGETGKWSCTMSVRGFSDNAVAEVARQPLWRDGGIVR